jgi:hypothetical protein
MDYREEGKHSMVTYERDGDDDDDDSLPRYFAV